MKKHHKSERLSLGEVLAVELKNDEFRVLFTKELIRNEIARLVVRIRKASGLTQSQLAKRAATTQAVIGRLESGADKRIPSLPLLARIASATGTQLQLSFPPRAR